LSEPALVTGSFEDQVEDRFLLHTDWLIMSGVDTQIGFEIRRVDSPEQTALSNFDIEALSLGEYPVPSYVDHWQPSVILESSERDIWGAYLQYRHTLSDALAINLGVRHDKAEEIGSYTSPRAGLIWQLTPQQTLKILYGEAFRMPSELELNLLNNPVLRGNKDLAPETIKTIDVIWLWNSSHLSYSAAYFKNRYEDAIVQKDNGDGTRQYQNSQLEDSQGIELEAYYKWDERWLFRAAFTKLFKTPDLMFRESEDIASATISHQWQSTVASLTASYAGSRNTLIGSELSELPAYGLLNGKIAYQVNKNWYGYLQGKNLTNKEYRTPTAGASLSEGTPNRGRELLMGIDWSF
jgi:outer membrane receptor protein involved in Fe transport